MKKPRQSQNKSKKFSDNLTLTDTLDYVTLSKDDYDDLKCALINNKPIPNIQIKQSYSNAAPKLNLGSRKQSNVIDVGISAKSVDDKTLLHKLLRSVRRRF